MASLSFLSASCVGTKYEKVGSATDAPALALLAVGYPLALPSPPRVSCGKSLRQSLRFSPAQSNGNTGTNYSLVAVSQGGVP